MGDIYPIISKLDCVLLLQIKMMQDFCNLVALNIAFILFKTSKNSSVGGATDSVTDGLKSCYWWLTIYDKLNT